MVNLSIFFLPECLHYVRKNGVDKNGDTDEKKASEEVKKDLTGIEDHAVVELENADKLVVQYGDYESEMDEMDELVQKKYGIPVGGNDDDDFRAYNNDVLFERVDRLSTEDFVDKSSNCGNDETNDSNGKIEIHPAVKKGIQSSIHPDNDHFPDGLCELNDFVSIKSTVTPVPSMTL